MTRSDDLIATLTLGEPSNADNESSHTIGSFNISGVAAAYARLATDAARQVIGRPKVSVTFALSSSGLIDISKAEAAIEMLEKYDDFELVPANSTKEARPLVEEDGGDTIKVADGTTVANATENATMIKVKVERERKRLHYISLKVTKQVLE